MATIEQVRMLVNDPEGTDQIFANAHYQLIVDMEDNVYRAASTAARTLSAYYAAKVKVTAGPVEIENQQKFEHYEALADSYDQRAREGGGSGAGLSVGAPSVTGISISEIEAAREEDDRYDSAFTRGLDSNTEKGNDYDA